MDFQEVLIYFERTTDQFLSRDEFMAKLRSGRQLRVKYSVDVKTPTLHIGHAVNLWLMRRLQDLGHKIVFVFADFTSRVGDTDGRLETISDMPVKEVEKNIADLLAQSKMILNFDDPALIEIRRNSEWYKKMSIQSMMDLFSLVTHAKLISGDNFQIRIAQGKEIYINEMLYPILQGYDSCMVQSDIAVIGSDQLFNESVGRLLQEKHKQKPQTLITTVMTPGIDGRNKQSQRRDNDISLFHSPRDKFGRVMSIPDALMEDYFRIYTDLPAEGLAEMKELIGREPRNAKIELAAAIVQRYHGEKVAVEERDWFDSTISKGYIPDDLPRLIVTTRHMEALDLVVLARPTKSRSDSRRLLAQGGVELNGRKLKMPKQEVYLKNGDILQAGRRHWFRIEVEELPTFETQRLSIRAMSIRDIPGALKCLAPTDISKYIVRFGSKKKKTEDAAEDAFKKIILQPAGRNEWLWVLASRENPDNILGMVHLRGDARDGLQNVWLVPGLADEAGIIDEAMTDLSEYTLSRLDPRGEAFKNAFAFATAPRNIEALHQAYKVLDTSLLSKMDAPQGLKGYTYDGWDALQAWRRVVTPWLFKNDPQRALVNTLKKNEPQAPK